MVNNGFILIGLQVAYERVNLADIETSSDEDDYGDLFAHVSHNIFQHICTYFSVWVTTYLILFHIKVKNQNIFIFLL